MAGGYWYGGTCFEVFQSEPLDCCTHSGIAALCLSWLEGAPVAGDGLEWSCVRASLLEGVAVGHWYGGTYFGDLTQSPYTVVLSLGLYDSGSSAKGTPLADCQISMSPTEHS